MTPKEKKEHELFVFHVMYWTHLAGFVMILASFKLKAEGYYDCK